MAESSCRWLPNHLPHKFEKETLLHCYISTYTFEMANFGSIVTLKLIKISNFFYSYTWLCRSNAKNIIIGPSIPKDETCRDQVGMSRASYQCNIGVKQCCTFIWIFKEGPLALSVFLIFQKKIIGCSGSLKKSKSKNRESWLFQPRLKSTWIELMLNFTSMPYPIKNSMLVDSKVGE